MGALVLVWHMLVLQRRLSGSEPARALQGWPQLSNPSLALVAGPNGHHSVGTFKLANYELLPDRLSAGAGVRRLVRCMCKRT